MPGGQEAPYGSWESPVTADLIVAGATALGQVVLDGDDVYWVEMRPRESGRNVIVRRTPDGQITDVTPAPFNARTRVHEYGGGAFTVANGTVYFTNFDDQRLYRQGGGGVPVPITPPGDKRCADMVVDAQRGRIICVYEDHDTESDEPVNMLVSIPANPLPSVPAQVGTIPGASGSSGATVLVSGADFYSSPRLSPDGAKLAWLNWDHPNMPWDGVELWVADLDDDGAVANAELVAGGAEESVFQPEWSPGGVLHFVSDRTGWWNLYRRQHGSVEALAPMEAEFGKPQWVFGTSTYAFDTNGRIVCSYATNSVWRVALLDPEAKRLDPIDIPFTEMGRGDIKAGNGRAVLEAGASSEPMSLISIDLESLEWDSLRRSSETTIDSGYLSPSQPIEFPTEDGLTAHGIYYAPNNRDYQPLPNEKPPLLVKSHGGPTSAASTALDLSIQFWTSRGFAVLDVNYGGSTGYGRAYRERLKGRWGIIDIDDCVNGARYLAERGLVDGDRLAIDGGSAGGYTTLAALAFRDVFKAGASYYGVSDLEALAKDTHKFESRYLDSLIGPYPQRMDLYRERSPIHFTDRLSCPLILFQGLEDKIVPPDQAETMFDAVKAKGIPTAYLAFEGEQHGFRRAENIKRTLEGELYFYSRVFGFDAAGALEPVDIVNL